MAKDETINWMLSKAWAMHQLHRCTGCHDNFGPLPIKRYPHICMIYKYFSRGLSAKREKNSVAAAFPCHSFFLCSLLLLLTTQQTIN